MAEKTQEETIALLNAKAKEAGNTFFVRIFRKQHSGGMPETVATFDNAQVEHLISPEQWLPQLAGGGPIFAFQVYHSSNRGEMVGGILTVNVSTTQAAPKSANEIDTKVVKRAGWAGPRDLLYPSPDGAKSDAAAFSISPNLPPVLPPGNSAANNVPGGGLPGAVYARDPVYERNASMMHHLEQEQAKFARMREEFAEQQRRDREELAEQKRKAELDSIRRESEQKLRELEAKFSAAAATPKTDLSQTVIAFASVLAPLLQKMMESQGELRLAMLKQQDAIAAQTAESNRTLMAAMMQRPSVDPVVERLFGELKSAMEKGNSQQVPQSTMLHSMADAMATMTQTTMDLVQTAADLNLGGGKNEEPVALRAMREGVKAIQSIFAGYQQSLPKPPPGAPGAPGAAAPKLPNSYTRAATAPPPPPAAAQTHMVQQPPEIAGTAAVPAPGGDVIDLMEEMFKSKAPVPDLVATFLAAFARKDPSLTRALEAVDWDIELLFSQRLAPFVMANPDYVPYMRELLLEVNRRGEAEGIFEDAPDEGDYDEDEEQDAA